VSLEFSEEQRAALGISGDERLRVLARNARTLVLERQTGTESIAYPWDRALVLQAEVRAFSFADLLELVHASSKSGFLSFEAGDVAKCVYFEKGEVVFAASNQPVDRLGDTLLRLAVIDANQFREAQRAYQPGVLFGRLLVERGVLEAREIWNGVKLQVEEIVRSLFSYGAGSLLFWEGEVRPDNVLRLALPTGRLIDEGLRRRDELLRFLAHLEDDRVRLYPSEGLPIEGAEQRFHEGLSDAPTFALACQRAGVDPLTGARTVQLLRLLGALRVERDHASGTPTRPSADDALCACVERYVKLMGELAAPVVAVDGPASVRARLLPVAQELAARHPALLGGISLGPAGDFDPAILSERARRIPGDRERAVRLALGEFVSYLEFDLLNHPRIDEPESFLDSLEALRSQL
jgi:hypothetical protein